jgi:phosphohistidine phosphatase
MMLYIIRHAIAAPLDPQDPQGDDSQRPLTNKGRNRMYRIARGLKELGEPLNLIVTSPYLRATQTARVLAKKLSLGRDKILVSEALTPAGQVEDLVKEINDKCKGVENIALVGHEPYLSRLTSLLLSGDPGLAITLKKGGVCRLSVETLQAGRCATLDWLLTPAQLVGIAG